jgi:purine-binding chemotaxis protein CheW
MQSTKQVIFLLGEEEYSLDIMDVNTIEKFIPYETVANFPKNLKGIIRLRGDIIPVYSLRRKFGLEDIQPNDDTRLIITTSSGVLIAYEVDKMLEIITLEQNQLLETPLIVKGKDSTDYLKNVVNFNDRLILVLNHDGILSEEEIDKINSINKK